MTTRGVTPAGVLAFSENPDVALELLAAGRPLADAAATGLTALVVGADAEARAAEAIARGADEALLVSLPEPGRLDAETYLEAVHAAVRAQQPAILLVGSTRTGVEVAARLAQRLRVGCVTDALTLAIAGDGSLEATRRAYGGRFVARVALRSVPAIATVPANRFEPPARDESRRGPVRRIPVEAPPARVRTQALEERPRSGTDLRKAQVIVSFGRGVKRPEDVPMIEALCRELGGALAGSRPITDERGWLPFDRKIGISGHTVRPSLYVACGISGQIEHVVGMRGARTVIAINSNPDAPIHAEADYSIVGDLYQVVPALSTALREARTRQAAGTLGGQE
jgi:electron transfer flavoprotein alpha subunit